MISGLHKVNRMRKSELCCTGRLLKTIFEMRTLYHFQKMSQWSRSTSAGMCLIEMHQHYPWGPILNGLMPLTRMTKHKNLQGFTKHKKKSLYHGLLGNKWEDIASMWEGKDCAAQKNERKMTM